MATTDESTSRLSERLDARLGRWRAKLYATGMDGLIGAFLSAAAPLGLLGAQILWIAQPALSVFMPRDEVGDLARLLADPEGVSLLRQKLTDSTDSEDA